MARIDQVPCPIIGQKSFLRCATISNVLILWAAAIKHRFASQYWGTFKAWNQLDCRIKTGERATGIIRWIEKKEVDPKTGQEEDKSFPVGHPVFNVAQVEGPEETMAKYGGNELPLVMVPASQPETKPLVEPELWEPAENLVTVLKPKLRWGGDSAHYSPGYDRIRMPERDRFETQAGLYSVLMHEVAHWTGHPKRLDRALSGGPKNARVLVRGTGRRTLGLLRLGGCRRSPIAWKNSQTLRRISSTTSICSATIAGSL